jgi:capsule polysaccharide export protein KpsE/RkpR
MSEEIHKEDAGLLIIVKHILKWRLPIIIITVVAILAAIIFTLPAIYPPKFQSVGVFYPTASTSISKGVLALDMSGRQDALKFGEEEEAEQLLQILESDAITGKIIEKYNLMKRYRIKQSDKYKLTNLAKEYYSNVSFRRNEHMAIEVSVLDEDPDTAALMCNDILSLMDSVKTNIVRQRAHDILAIVEKEYKKKEQEIRLLEGQLAEFGEKGIINYEEQAAAMSEALDKAKADYYAAFGNYGENSSKTKAMKARLEDVQGDYNNLGKYGGAWLSVKEGLVLENEQFKVLKEKYEQAKVDVEQTLTYKFVINYPSVPEKKAKPVRSLIVIVSTLAAFLLSSLFFILYEIFNKNKRWLLSKD